jgi:hypothetical protein
MPFHYAIEFIHRDSAGDVKFRTTLAGSQILKLPAMPGPLDVALEEIPETGTGSGTFRLTLTEAGVGPRSDISGTWDYEIFFVHQAADGAARVESLATGSHFLGLRLDTGLLEITLEELPEQERLDPRLRLAFRNI